MPGGDEAPSAAACGVPRRTVLAAGAGLAVSWLGACAGDDAGAQPGRVGMSAGPGRSVYLGWSAALGDQVHRDHPDLTFDVQVSTGSIENLQRLASGAAMLAVASADAADVALRGEPPFDRQVGVMALGRVYDDYVHVIVRDDSVVTELHELAGRTVAVGPPGSGTALVADRIVADQGLTVRTSDLDVVDAGLELQARRLDALFSLGGLPTRAVTELAGRVRIRLLPLDDVAARLRSRYGTAYRAASIPPFSYGSPDGVPTVASANLLLCRPDAPAGLVTAILGTAFLRRDELAAAQPAGNALDVRTAIVTAPVPLHPAAAAYYRHSKP
jgi:TRAP transporter TAXI family solute receptor